MVDDMLKSGETIPEEARTPGKCTQIQRASLRIMRSMLRNARRRGKGVTKSAGNGRIGCGGAIPLPGQRAAIRGELMRIFVIVCGGLVFYIFTVVPHHRMPNPAAQGPVVGRPGREAERAGGDFQQG